MVKPDAWMPHYIGDYNMETAHLTAQQDGIYMRLRSFYWKTGGPIPSDLGILVRVARVFSKMEYDDLTYVLATYFVLKENQYHHHELDKRYQGSWDRYKKKSEAGKKAVAAREKKKLDRLIAVSVDDQSITKTKTISLKQEAVTDSQHAMSQEMMSVMELNGLAGTYFNQDINCVDFQNYASEICAKLSKDVITEGINKALENGVIDFRHLITHFRNLMDKSQKRSC